MNNENALSKEFGQLKTFISTTTKCRQATKYKLSFNVTRYLE